MQITYPINYFPSNWNILTFFYHFSICLVSFYIILCKLSSFMRIYAFKKEKLWANVVFTTTAIFIYFASLTLICKLLLLRRIALETKISILNSQIQVAKFQLVSCNLSLAMIWQMTYTLKLPNLCSATLSSNCDYISVLCLLSGVFKSQCL